MHTIIFQDDLPSHFADMVIDKKQIGWDIETSGLNWKTDRIATCQILIPGENIAIVQISEQVPNILTSLLINKEVCKVFHHAMFDLRFMSYKWKLHPANVACTKIAAKILDRSNQFSHSLQSVLKQYLNVEVDKKERLSNWFSEQLTDNQVSYAANDVFYLLPLLATLENKMLAEGTLELARACFDFIPTKVHLDIMGYRNMFDYVSTQSSDQ